MTCSFSGKQRGGDSFFIALEPLTPIPGLPVQCVIGFTLTNPKSRELVKRVERFLNDNIAGISITT